MPLPPTCARIRQTGCRGRQPLRSKPRSPVSLRASAALPPPPGALGVPQCAHWGGGGAADGRGLPWQSVLPSPCHCEPVTDVTGVAIRSPVPVGATIGRPPSHAHVRQAAEQCSALRRINCVACGHDLNPDLHQREAARPLAGLPLFGGGCRIRTRVDFRPNGFQDRPVMTASVTLRVC